MPIIRQFRPIFLVLLVLLGMLLSFASLAAQGDGMGVGQPARVEINGINPLELPYLYVTVSVTDSLGRTVRDLQPGDFALFEEIGRLGRLVDVEQVTNDHLSYAVVLVLDTSTSMAGRPLSALQEAAKTFINLIGGNAPIALIAFDANVQYIQDFTTDSAALRRSIDKLLAGGQTALYQASYEAVELAADAPTPRRAVIILSDGHEFGGVSKAKREDARIAAENRGVPVYTIGLGYDEFDRDYLQELSAAGYGIFTESPSPEELIARYREFASLFRNQYILTVEADLPLDGSTYPLGVTVRLDDGKIDSDRAIVRAPIPVPYISLLLELPLTPIEQQTTFSFSVMADDELQEVSITLNGEAIAAEVVERVYSVAVDPVEMAPGPHKLTVSARDVDGDTGGLAVPFNVGALPPEITVFSPLLAEPVLRDPVEVAVTVGGQTPFATAEIVLDGVSAASLDEDIRVWLDPYDFNMGPHELEFIITNQAGMSASELVPFEVPPLPPVFQIEGLAAGAFLQEIAQVDLGIITSQVGSELTRSYRINDGPELSAEEGITLDPRDLPPGENSISVTIEDRTTGQLSEETIDFEVATLRPEASIEGLEQGETMRADRSIQVEVESQTEVLRVVARLNGEEIERILEPPYEVDLEVLELPPGEHTLEIQVVNEGLREEVTTVEFNVAEEPAQTATAVVVTATERAAATATGIVRAMATQRAEATAREIVQATATGAVRATATGEAIATAAEIIRATATGEANAAATEIMRAMVTQEAVAAATGEARATAAEIVRATATQEAIATATQETIATATEIVRAMATQEAIATAAEIVRATATQEAIATATQEAIATATQEAIATATQETIATATGEAIATATEIVRATATQEAIATATQEAIATATQEVIATATQEAIATATQEAIATATEIVRATATQEAIATATQEAIATATQEAIATATEIVRATATQEAIATATQEAIATATQEAIATATEIVWATATQEAIATATQEAIATATEIVRATATQEAIATATQEAIATATEIVRATATQEAIATATQEAIATATEIVRATATQETIATATQEAIATATGEAIATATEIVRATATQEAIATATEIVRATATQEAIATATEIVRATATQEAIATATQEAIATEIVRATATQEAIATATQEAIVTATQEAIATATGEAIATATQETIATATQEAIATATEIVRATATQEAIATATQEAIATAMEIVRATATQEAIATATDQPSVTPSLVATDLPAQPLDPTATPTPLVLPAAAEEEASETPAAVETATDIPPTDTDIPPTDTDVPPTVTDIPPTDTDVPPTVTNVLPAGTPEPTATLIPVEITPPAEPADNTPLLVVSLIVLLVLSVAFYLLRRRRR